MARKLDILMFFEYKKIKMSCIFAVNLWNALRNVKWERHQTIKQRKPRTFLISIQIQCKPAVLSQHVCVIASAAKWRLV